MPTLCSDKSTKEDYVLRCATSRLHTLKNNIKCILDRLQLHHRHPNYKTQRWICPSLRWKSCLELPSDLQHRRQKKLLQPPSLKLVTFWHFCVKAQRRGFHKAFVVFLAAGYCFIPSACAAEGQVCAGKRRYGTAGHIHSQYSAKRKRGLNKLIVFFLLPYCVKSFCMCSLYFQM